MYDIAMYTCANVEKMANSQVRLDAHSDYSVDSAQNCNHNNEVCHRKQSPHGVHVAMLQPTGS